MHHYKRRSRRRRVVCDFEVRRSATVTSWSRVALSHSSPWRNRLARTFRPRLACRPMEPWVLDGITELYYLYLKPSWFDRCVWNNCAEWWIRNRISRNDLYLLLCLCGVVGVSCVCVVGQAVRAGKADAVRLAACVAPQPWAYLDNPTSTTTDGPPSLETAPFLAVIGGDISTRWVGYMEGAVETAVVSAENAIQFLSAGQNQR